jgi:hypothetical protein
MGSRPPPGPIELDSNLYCIWYENEAGERWVPHLAGPEPMNTPDGFFYHHAQFPFYVNHDVLKVVQRAEVDACQHDPDDVRPDRGLIDGYRGRCCGSCGGRQVIADDGRDWPPVWDASGSIRIISGERGYPGELVLAMTRPTEDEKTRSHERWVASKRPERPLVKRLYGLDDAILIAARACEGCMNVLLWEYGCNDGYPWHSPDHLRAGTSCLFCKPEPTIRQVSSPISASVGAP